MRRFKLWLPLLGLLALVDSNAQGQTVAFIPIPAPVPDGQFLTVTPVATADRRYVRLTLDAAFYGFQSFDTFPVPGAVSGGTGLGGGGFGGLGGLGGGAGGGGGGGGRGGNGAGGLQSVGVPMAGSFDAGINGLTGPTNPYMTYAGTEPFLNQQNPAFATNDPFRRAAMQAQQPAATAPRATTAARPQTTQRTPRTSATRKRSAPAKAKRAN